MSLAQEKMGPAGAEALNVCPWTLEFGDTFKDRKNTLGTHSNLTELVIRLRGGIWFPRQKVQLRVKSRAAEGVCRFFGSRSRKAKVMENRLYWSG